MRDEGVSEEAAGSGYIDTAAHQEHSEPENIEKDLRFMDIEKWLDAGYSMEEAFQAVMGRPIVKATSPQQPNTNTNSSSQKQPPPNQQKQPKKKRMAHHPRNGAAAT